MTAIILCDDDCSVLTMLGEIIGECITEEQLPFHIACATTKPGEVVSYLEEHPDAQAVFFLDVKLESKLYDGIELGVLVRKANPGNYLIYISCHIDAALSTYEYALRCFDFIPKEDPGIKDRISRDLNRIRLETEGGGRAGQLMEYRHQIIDTSRLLYIETSKDQHRIRIIHEDSFAEVWGSLAELQQKLPHYFYLSHRGVLVNLRKVRFISITERKLYFINGASCDGAAARLRELKKKEPKLFLGR